MRLVYALRIVSTLPFDDGGVASSLPAFILLKLCPRILGRSPLPLLPDKRSAVTSRQC